MFFFIILAPGVASGVAGMALNFSLRLCSVIPQFLYLFSQGSFNLVFCLPLLPGTGAYLNVHLKSKSIL